MKVVELTEQLQRRKSPEELAAVKAAPDYWKKDVRKEFNAIIGKYGAVSREKRGVKDHHSTLKFDREISVLVSGQGSITLHRDIRAKALLNAIGKWLFKYREAGYGIGIGYWGSAGSVPTEQVNGTETLEKIMHFLNDAARLDSAIQWLHDNGPRGEKAPVKFDLRFMIAQPSKQ